MKTVLLVFVGHAIDTRIVDSPDIIVPGMVFLLIVQKAEEMGFTWGGRWRGLPDYHHFET